LAVAYRVDSSALQEQATPEANLASAACPVANNDFSWLTCTIDATKTKVGLLKVQR